MEQKNLDIYGNPPLPWSRALDQLEAAADTQAPRTTWLSTVRPDGRPHLTGVGALWVDGKFYFTSGASTRKSRNLAANPNCALSMVLKGLDLAVEGRAEKVTDPATLERLAARYAAQGWPARAIDGALTAEFSAPSAGPAPWELYVVTPVTAFGVATAEPYGATRWRFDRSRS
ncbi:MAG: pyridoxamine 5'-phosphate oxidase family protein [Chloroflexi bacterium]|nr:MAG: pyridoxamine 5'-phosphate oxidase family protein [Chloroflexota bacterium]